mmetsp:Transcript_15496/g.44526  ORF Transcript_15496/g.44526 Transcript_15496/m.44526 type:complete len:405 (-) Transcript_15496:177-1391(-)
MPLVAGGHSADDLVVHHLVVHLVLRQVADHAAAVSALATEVRAESTAMAPRARSAVALLAIAHGAAAITSEMQVVLDQHNIYRCMHGVPLLTWDDAIAANAQAWADNGAYEHSSSSSRLVNGELCGENLAWGYPSRSGKDSTMAWYSEIEFTDPYGTADSMDDTTKPREAIGHYTQVVWSTSLKLGCGKGKATVSGNLGDYWVCQYGPAGNYGGQFSDKVKAPVKTANECAGSSGGTTGAVTTAPPASALPSACTPSTPLPVGGLCVYGYQCASKFCCPRLKLCLANASSSVGSSDVKVKGDSKDAITSMIFGGGSCRDPYSNGSSCMQDSSGQPLSSWDQSVCGCTDEYMEHYTAGTWVALNDIAGLVCESGANKTSISAAQSRVAVRSAYAAVGAAIALFAM